MKIRSMIRIFTKRIGFKILSSPRMNRKNYRNIGWNGIIKDFQLAPASDLYLSHSEAKARAVYYKPPKPVVA